MIHQPESQHHRGLLNISCYHGTFLPSLFLSLFVVGVHVEEEKMSGSQSQCCKNPPDLSSSCEVVGSVAEFGGLKSYITGNADSKFSIILISDLFGYEAPKLRKLADKYATAGYYVLVPDFFYGDPYVPEKWLSIKDWVKHHGPDKGFEDVKPVIAALKSEGISEIGAAGFCWGAKVVAELAKSDYIQAGVMIHPAMVTVDDIKEVKAPLAILGAEIDKVSPPELLKQFEEVLSTKPEVKAYVKIFPGVVHGWAVRYKDDDEIARKGAEESHQNMLDWFDEHVKKIDDVAASSLEHAKKIDDVAAISL